MTTLCRIALALVAALTITPHTHAIPFADSQADFSDTQGQANWFYGFIDRGGPTPTATAYDPDTDFVPFDLFDAPAQRWEATDAILPAQNIAFLSINQDGGHPSGIGPSGQDSVIWATRRYVSDMDGLIDIAFDLRKENISEPRGGGIIGRIFVDGVEVFTQPIANDDATGVQGVLWHPVTIGTRIDFAIDPTGTSPGSDSDFSARADGSIFSAQISQSVAMIPEPLTTTLTLLSATALTLTTRRRAT